MEVSTSPVPGGTEFVNDGFGNRCVICGGYFDEEGICNHGHTQGAIYYRPPEKKPGPKAVVEKKSAAEMVKCQVINGCQCSICGGFFGDHSADVVCPSGHEIGCSYST